MQIEIQNKPISIELMQVPEFNFGQFQRWKNHEQIKYQLEIEISSFFNSIESFFNEFRMAEIEDDDTMDLAELVAYKNINRPTLDELLEKHQTVLCDLILYNSYDILHLLFNEQLTKEIKYFYSVNSIDAIRFTNSNVLISGICFLINRS